jgi:competence/damage-inducible protein CinA-like protein
MPSAEIITIGTELLLGEIVDTNSRYIARCLRDVGIDLYRKTTVGDNIERIAHAVQQSMERCDIIITTGGLGPTIDDPTREAIALALGVETKFHPQLWEEIKSRFHQYGRKPTENNRRQAYLPEGAIPVNNPVGTAPAFIVELAQQVIISLPGVPGEMKYLMDHEILPYLQEHYHLTEIIKARIIHTAGVGESPIDELIADLEMLSNPTVGLAAHSGQVDVRITAKADSEIQADKMIDAVEEEIRRRLGDWVYGADAESLETIALHHLDEKGWKLAVIEAGLHGELTRRLATVGHTFANGEVLSNSPSLEELFLHTSRFRQARQAEVGLGVAVGSVNEEQEIHIVLITPEEEKQRTYPYRGPVDNAWRWAMNYCLNVIRNL